MAPKYDQLIVLAGMDAKELAEVNEGRRQRWFAEVGSCSSHVFPRELSAIVSGYSFTPERPRFDWRTIRGFGDEDCELICKYEGLVLHVSLDNPLGWDWSVANFGRARDELMVGAYDQYVWDQKADPLQCFPVPRSWRDACNFAEIVAEYMVMRRKSCSQSQTSLREAFGTLTYLTHRPLKNKRHSRCTLPSFPHIKLPSELDER